MDYIKMLSERFKLSHEWTDGGITVLRGENLYLQITEPTQGNDFQYCVLAEFSRNFQGWSNASFEERFINDGGFLQTMDRLVEFLNELK
ncbi:hypothetical protein [Paenibacillus silvae]|uniref:Uncharacterized protein n=1 Tax=Paenibacillus silvae TaxID=1325358 RepID=A0A2W6NNN1_9BACL|nr:hypothetical protein [Paenibacillus silvae]PZT57444.1 hypothetical protein DN757_01965 [Paenibacillus silvae]